MPRFNLSIFFSTVKVSGWNGSKDNGFRKQDQNFLTTLPGKGNMTTKHDSVLRNERMPFRKPKPKNLVQAIERASFLLNILGQNPQGISIRNLSLEVKLPKATTHRLLSSLLYFGYVRQDPNTRNYFLGFKLVELGNLLLNQLDIRKEAELSLRQLAEKTRETVHMVFLDHDEIVYVEKVEGDRNPGGLRMGSRVGLRSPAHCCAVGKVLLSFLPEDDLDRLLKKRKLVPRTENTIITLPQLKEHLKTVRMQGYAMDDEENEKGIRCVAAPIYDESGNAVAAVSISGPAFRVTRKGATEDLKDQAIQTALTISRRLGYRDIT